MNQSLPELMDEILKQISEQFEAAVEKLTKRLADLTATKEKQNTSPTLSTDTLDGIRKPSNM